MTEQPRINLDGAWSLFYFPAGKYDFDHPGILESLNLTPITAKVPGNTLLDLFREGLIPNPFFGENFQDLRHFENFEWWYLKNFIVGDDIPNHKYRLILRGVDTFGTVWIKDKFVGDTDNMLIPHRFPVDNLIPGENQIAIRLRPAVNEARTHVYEPAMMSWENRDEGLFIRMAPHVWDWDIMPRIVSVGLWRSLWLEPEPEIEIEDQYFWTANVNDKGADLGMWFQFHTPDVDITSYNLKVVGYCGDHEFSYKWPVEFSAGRCLIPVPGARLWWPKGYGDPNLYKVTVQLRKKEQVLASKSQHIGIRKVSIARTELAEKRWKPEPANNWPERIDRPIEHTHHFVFKVKKVPVMVKGTNWVPLDAFHSRDKTHRSSALKLAKDIGCNMIRC